MNDDSNSTREFVFKELIDNDSENTDTIKKPMGDDVNEEDVDGGSDSARVVTGAVMVVHIVVEAGGASVGEEVDELSRSGDGAMKPSVTKMVEHESETNGNIEIFATGGRRSSRTLSV